MTITGVDLTQGDIQTKPFSPVDIFTTTLVDLPPAADHEGALVYVAGTGLLLSDGVTWSSVAGPGSPSFPGVTSGAVWQQFSLSIINDGGVLKHRFGAANEPNQHTQSSENFSAVRNAATSYSVTPNGPDDTTGFSGGAKIQATSGGIVTKTLYLDTDDQDPSDSVGIQAVVVWNTTGSPVQIFPIDNGTPVDGISKIRMSLQFRNPSTGADFTLNTTNISSGKEIRIVVTGFMRPLSS